MDHEELQIAITFTVTGVTLPQRSTKNPNPAHYSALDLELCASL